MASQTPFDRHEVPFDGFTWWADQTRPESPTQALMQCGPDDIPMISAQELIGVREAIGSAFDVLTPKEVWVFNALVIERLSLRTVANQICTPKTTVARIRDRATRKLRAALEDDPEVIAFRHRVDAND
jgi:DNA-directed RNA polymerase specialized sigma24 family protein